MKFLVGVMASLVLTACATSSGKTGAESGANLEEAARINTQLGMDYMRKGNVAMAEEKLKRAVAQDPKSAIAHTVLGVVYSRRGKDEEAERAFREALTLAPDNPESLNNYGIFLCSKGKLDKAEEAFLKVARNRDYPHPELAWTNAGVCLRRSNLEKAEQYLREALKINPKFPDALSQFAMLSYQKGDHLRTRAFLQRYEVVARPSAETLWLRWKTEVALGDRETARKYEQRLKTEFPEAAIPESFLKSP
jgi:type IV pilus assembly protein PilF